MSRKLLKLFSGKYKKDQILRYVYDFIFDYDAIADDDSLHIHEYLMKKCDV